MRLIFPVIALGVAAACSPKVPDSAAGVGFDDPAAVRAQRDAELEGLTVDGQPLAPPGAVSEETLAPAGTTTTGAPLSATAPQSSGTNADIALETAAALNAVQSNSGVAPVQASPDNPAPALVSNPGISDENDFAAVSGRRSIDADAEHIARTRDTRTVVEPTAVPERPSGTSSNVVGYALSTTHPKGTRVYSRSGLNLVAKAQKACAKYGSPDQAQIAFLDKGGPERDRLGVDPDGDGYACAWDPAPYRKARNN